MSTVFLLFVLVFVGRKITHSKEGHLPGARAGGRPKHIFKDNYLSAPSGSSRRVRRYANIHLFTW